MTGGEEISKKQSFNLIFLQEAMRQAELKINDEHTRKERIDQRVYSLLTLMVPMLIAILGTVVTLWIHENTVIQLDIFSVMLLTISLSPLFISICYLLEALKPRLYGALGCPPKVWLEYYNNLIGHNSKNTKQNELANFLLRVILPAYQKNVEASDEANNERVTLLNKAIKLAIIYFPSSLFIAILVVLVYKMYYFPSSLIPNSSKLLHLAGSSSMIS